MDRVAPASLLVAVSWGGDIGVEGTCPQAGTRQLIDVLLRAMRTMQQAPSTDTSWKDHMPTPPSDARFTLGFEEVSAADLARVGGKGANLGALTRAGVPVPSGYCVTTGAFDRFIASLQNAEALFAGLEALDGSSVDAARHAAEAMRTALDTLPVPPDVARDIVTAWRALGTAHPLAVRSSATAEDLPGASFAGQQDTYLNVLGEPALLDAVRRCWISLFTDRAVLYRARGGFGHRAVRLAVVVQRLVDPDVSGILFTADPVSGNRHVASVDAGLGLGEALVGGLISADLYRVDRRERRVLLARPGDKAFAIRSSPGGGTRREPLSDAQRHARVLDDTQLLALVTTGDRIETAFGGVPQDIEWCLAGGELFVVQARPITSLFPIPRVPSADDALRIFFSFGHFQMMLDPMPRLGLEAWQLFLPAGKSALDPDGPALLSPVMTTAAGRLFADVTALLRVPATRRAFLTVLSVAYEELGRELAALSERPEFRRGAGRAPALLRSMIRILGPVLGRIPLAVFVLDPAKGAEALNRALDEEPRGSGDRIRARTTPGDRLRQAAREMATAFVRIRRHLPRILGAILSHRLLLRLARGTWADGVRDDVDRLLRGLPGNVTTEMDLAVGDLSDLARPHAELVKLLSTKPWPVVRERLPTVSGGAAFQTALDQFLSRYGVRGAGEIDLTRPRWIDDPSLLLRVVTGGLSSAEGAHRTRHRAQVAEGEAAARRLEEAASRGVFGPMRGRLVRRLVRVVRLGAGLREHPKFFLVRTLALARAEALEAGKLLAARGRIEAVSDVWHLGFAELADALDDPAMDLRDRIAARKAELRVDRLRKPPIAITSDGEIPMPGVTRADLPPGTLSGTAASRGVVEGLARVVTDPDREVLHAGEILVAPFTDPGWTPLFVHAAGVVTEVGGLMTHGAVVAREYGIPAVVSVASAVERIRTGQRIRVDGDRGIVELLEP